MTIVTLYTEKKLLEDLLTTFSQKLLVNFTDNYMKHENQEVERLK